MEILLNGEARDVTATPTLQTLMAALALENQLLAVAINREIIPRPQWAERQFAQNDQVDIVRAIGGG